MYWLITSNWLIPFELIIKVMLDATFLKFPVVACINACSPSSCHRIWMIALRICWKTAIVSRSGHACLLQVKDHNVWHQSEVGAMKCFHHVWGLWSVFITCGAMKCFHHMLGLWSVFIICGGYELLSNSAGFGWKSSERN